MEQKPRQSDTARWFLDPGSEPCARCGQPRAEHRQTRSGSICLGGRRFKPTVTREDIAAYLAEAPDREETAK